MSGDKSRHSSVGRSHEIDQRAIKIFLNFLPDSWLPRKQEPDFFVDYLVEVVEKGELTGVQFAVQVKGYEDALNGKKPLRYSFKSKHLKYYRDRSQHPVFLFLINVTTGEGYWLFAQEHLQSAAKLLDSQGFLSVHFSKEDSLLNPTKFQCLLPEAEKFVRDLHPGSVKAALEKRKAELESKDPRCSVAISVKDGCENVVIIPKQEFSGEIIVRSKNLEGWRNFIERGSQVKLEPGEIEISGAPLLEDALKTPPGGSATIQFRREYPASVQISCGDREQFQGIHVNGRISAGTKFITFSGSLPESPLEMTVEIPVHGCLSDSAPGTILFSFDKWSGQALILLSHFDQIKALVRSAAASTIATLECSYQSNTLWKGSIGNLPADEAKNMLGLLEWLSKCRWIARHFKVDTVLPKLKDISNEQWEGIEYVYGLMNGEVSFAPKAGSTISILGTRAVFRFNRNDTFAGVS